MDRMIIGLTGPIASGKGIVSDLLASVGFTVFSLSDILREKARELGIEINRENLQNLGNELRLVHGTAFLAELVYEKVARVKGNIVIDSIRNLGEIEFLREHMGAIIIGVDAPDESREYRFLHRAVKRVEDAIDLPHSPKFMELSARDRGEDVAYGQQVDACLLSSDYMLFNEGDDEAAFRREAKEFLQVKFGLEINGEGNGIHSIETLN